MLGITRVGVGEEGGEQLFRWRCRVLSGHLAERLWESMSSRQLRFRVLHSRLAARAASATQSSPFPASHDSKEPPRAVSRQGEQQS